jgi:hypothetical protein
LENLLGVEAKRYQIRQCGKDDGSGSPGLGEAAGSRSSDSGRGRGGSSRGRNQKWGDGNGLFHFTAFSRSDTDSTLQPKRGIEGNHVSAKQVGIKPFGDGRHLISIEAAENPFQTGLSSSS